MAKKTKWAAGKGKRAKGAPWFYSDWQTVRGHGDRMTRLRLHIEEVKRQIERDVAAYGMNRGIRAMVQYMSALQEDAESLRLPVRVTRFSAPAAGAEAVEQAAASLEDQNARLARDHGQLRQTVIDHLNGLCVFVGELGKLAHEARQTTMPTTLQFVYRYLEEYADNMRQVLADRAGVTGKSDVLANIRPPGCAPVGSSSLGGSTSAGSAGVVSVGPSAGRVTDAA